MQNTNSAPLPPRETPSSSLPASALASGRGARGGSKGSSGAARWLLVGVIVGFFLPVCACAMLMLSVGGLASSSVPFDSSTMSVESGDAVAIVRVEGVIVSSDNTDFSTNASSAVVIEDLQKAAADPDVKAIVLRVNSPGGSVTGSAQIYEVIKQIEKPIVVSMAGLAASGGYYVSAPTTYIFARPDTFTGSIGVIMSIPNAEKFFDEWGVEVTTLTSGPNKELGSVWHDLTPEQEALLQTIINESYNEFVAIVAEGREINEDIVRQIADGRIYTGRQALENGLVDELGNLEDATAKAAELGGISGEPRIIEYDHTPTVEDFLSGFAIQIKQSESDLMLQQLYELASPKIEYRYLGPRAD
ncbi:MAG: signal peptide peptidase SppA [Ardenticatenaceae bacterium]